jgi:hypothetical protein
MQTQPNLPRTQFYSHVEPTASLQPSEKPTEGCFRCRPPFEETSYKPCCQEAPGDIMKNHFAFMDSPQKNGLDFHLGALLIYEKLRSARIIR